MSADAHASGAYNMVFRIEEMAGVGSVRLALTGELDALTASVFRRRMFALRAADTTVRLDLSRLAFIDSAGARALLDAVAVSGEGVWHLEVEPEFSGPVRRYFELLDGAGVSVEL